MLYKSILEYFIPNPLMIKGIKKGIRCLAPYPFCKYYTKKLTSMPQPRVSPFVFVHTHTR